LINKVIKPEDEGESKENKEVEEKKISEEKKVII